jgi:hypothetical protein
MKIFYFLFFIDNLEAVYLEERINHYFLFARIETFSIIKGSISSMLTHSSLGPWVEYFNSKGLG